MLSDDCHSRTSEYAMRNCACVYQVSGYDYSRWLALLIKKRVYRSKKVPI